VFGFGAVESWVSLISRLSRSKVGFRLFFGFFGFRDPSLVFVGMSGWGANVFWFSHPAWLWFAGVFWVSSYVRLFSRISNGFRTYLGFAHPAWFSHVEWLGVFGFGFRAYIGFGVG